MRFFLFLFLLGISSSVKAQVEEKKIEVKPTIHLRSFWMNTAYPGQSLKSDYALGISLLASSRITYAKNWTVELGYRAFSNAFSSEIWIPDPTTGQSNRYETGLFDILEPEDRFFGKLELFSLDFSSKKYQFKVGRMPIYTDWVNGQDGRLSPTVVEGLNATFIPSKQWRISLWAIGRMSIRGSSEWLGVGETLGIYPQGRTIFGKQGNYFGNTESKWLGVLELDRQLSNGSKLHYSHTLAQNLFSTSWALFEKNWKINSSTWSIGIQSGIQHGLGTGGNSNSNFAYKNPKDLNYAVSGRFGWGNGRWNSHLSFTHVGGEGRWLSPREWGKDAWYTFIPRERNEGFESVNAWVGYLEYRSEKIPVQVYAHGGFHWLSDAANVAANKYNFPSYRQLNLGLKYQPKKISNLDIHFIFVSKEPLTSEKLTAIQIYNKVELLHFNGIINWKWN